MHMDLLVCTRSILVDDVDCKKNFGDRYQHIYRGAK